MKYDFARAVSKVALSIPIGVYSQLEIYADGRNENPETSARHILCDELMEIDISVSNEKESISKKVKENWGKFDNGGAVMKEMVVTVATFVADDMKTLVETIGVSANALAAWFFCKNCDR